MLDEDTNVASLPDSTPQLYCAINSWRVESGNAATTIVAGEVHVDRSIRGCAVHVESNSYLNSLSVKS